MLLKEDPVEQVYFLRVIDWIQGKILLLRFVCGLIFVMFGYSVLFSLYKVNEDREKLIKKVMVDMLFLPVLFMIVVYVMIIADLTDLQKKAEGKFRPLQSEGPKTYETITRFGRKVSMWLWGYFVLTLFAGISLNCFKEVRSLWGFYDWNEGNWVLTGLAIVSVIVLWMYPLTLVSMQARWTYHIWAQMVLLKNNIKSTLGVRISKDDRESQKLCKKYLREVVKFHSDIKSIANDYYYNIMRNTAIVLFVPGSCAAAMPFVLFFTDVPLIVKLGIFVMEIEISLFAYIAVMNVQSIIDETENLCNVLYDCPWYDWDRNNCSILIIMMSVMKKPLLNTNVFGVVEINYKLFLKTFRVVYGVVTAVLNLE